MKASELREGNFALNNKGDVVEIRVSHLLYISNNPDNKYSGIPLTAEWLEKFVFEETQNAYFFKYHKIHQRPITNYRFELDYLDETTYAWIEGNCIVHIKYVHELQNLYYSTCYSELEIKKTSS